jgi:hypothetical protein
MGAVVTVTGPLFTGQVDAWLDAALTDAVKEVADYAEYQWQMNMINSFVNPSSPPRYQSEANVAKRGSDLVVNDGYPGSGLLYGPWLEGVGSRNATSRFKGYSSMRRATATVDRMTAAIIKPVFDAFTARANGL